MFMIFKPLIIFSLKEVQGLLSAEEADEIVNLAGPRMKKSGVLLRDGETQAEHYQLVTNHHLFG